MKIQGMGSRKKAKKFLEKVNMYFSAVTCRLQSMENSA